MKHKRKSPPGASGARCGFSPAGHACFRILTARKVRLSSVKKDTGNEIKISRPARRLHVRRRLRPRARRIGLIHNG